MIVRWRVGPGDGATRGHLFNRVATGSESLAPQGSTHGYQAIRIPVPGRLLASLKSLETYL